MNVVRIVLVALTFVLTASAPTPMQFSPVNQAWLFSQKHPEEFRKYSSISPISIRYLEVSGEAVNQIVAGIILGVRQSAEDPESLEKFLKEIEEVDFAAQFSLKDVGLFERLKPLDELFFFEYRLDGYRDDGIVVVRSGEIVYLKIFNWVSFGESTRRADIDEL